MLIPIESWLLGLAQGMRHALEPDHLAAVSTMVTRTTSRRAQLRFAAAWGLGHAFVLFAVGGALYFLRREMPTTLSMALELVVAVMLLALGARSLREAIVRGPGEAAVPLGGHPRHGESSLPFFVGIVHGLAGSGAMTALLVAHQESVVHGALLLFLYSFGSIAGMAALAGVVGLPLAHLAKNPIFHRGLMAASGLLSLGIGIYWGALVLAP